MNYEIDATNKKIGRIASEAASVLMGKNTPAFARNKAPAVSVHILNASKVDIADKKKSAKEYTHYSGYPGGLKTESMKKVIGDKGYTEVVRRAVYGMLPSNKLRAQMIKNLTIKE